MVLVLLWSFLEHQLEVFEGMRLWYSLLRLDHVYKAQGLACNFVVKSSSSVHAGSSSNNSFVLCISFDLPTLVAVKFMLNNSKAEKMVRVMIVNMNWAEALLTIQFMIKRLTPDWGLCTITREVKSRNSRPGHGKR